jgi:hypothetical protein
MKNPEYGFKCARTSRPNLAAGNGLFGCRDGAPKFAGKATELLQRQKSEKWIAENPGRNALFGVVPEWCGLRRLDGGRTRARTWDPLIKTKLSLYCRTGLRSARRDTPFYHCRLGTENVVRIVVQKILDQDQAD